MWHEVSNTKWKLTDETGRAEREDLRLSGRIAEEAGPALSFKVSSSQDSENEL